MKCEIMTVKNYKELIELVSWWRNNSDCDVLIDFQSRKKRFSSSNVTVTFIPHIPGALSIEYRDKFGYHIIDNKDKSIKYTCGVYGRYEYFPKDTMPKFGFNRLDERCFTREYKIGFSNKFSDTFVDNGRNKEWYDDPDVSSETSLEEVCVFEGVKLINPYIIKERCNGAIELYDKDTKQLKYVCNIGRRYEYYFKGRYEKILSSYHISTRRDILVKLEERTIYGEKRLLPFLTLIDHNDNPYIVKEREDGGIDLVSKKDGSLKYICNIGKSFYYFPYESNFNYLSGSYEGEKCYP
jgi:hypothetical protein